METNICRLCMSKDNLTSIWGKADGEKINDKIKFVCGLIVSLILLKVFIIRVLETFNL